MDRGAESEIGKFKPPELRIISAAIDRAVGFVFPDIEAAKEGTLKGMGAIYLDNSIREDIQRVDAQKGEARLSYDYIGLHAVKTRIRFSQLLDNRWLVNFDKSFSEGTALRADLEKAVGKPSVGAEATITVEADSPQMGRDYLNSIGGCLKPEALLAQAKDTAFPKIVRRLTNRTEDELGQGKAYGNDDIGKIITELVRQVDRAVQLEIFAEVLKAQIRFLNTQQAFHEMRGIPFVDKEINFFTDPELREKANDLEKELDLEEKIDSEGLPDRTKSKVSDELLFFFLNTNPYDINFDVVKATVEYLNWEPDPRNFARSPLDRDGYFRILLKNLYPRLDRNTKNKLFDLLVPIYKRLTKQPMEYEDKNDCLVFGNVELAADQTSLWKGDELQVLDKIPIYDPRVDAAIWGRFKGVLDLGKNIFTIHDTNQRYTIQVKPSEQYKYSDEPGLQMLINMLAGTLVHKGPAYLSRRIHSYKPDRSHLSAIEELANIFLRSNDSGLQWLGLEILKGRYGTGGGKPENN